ncbi:DMT family transporter [Methylobacterium sp. Leaf117]|uniref:DMT family transporter n=1 Tax=Methylobacterium sp. Leaf117 TaxID=1736260 RepID=UPI0006F891EF|nr:DMT family transporter [Methylobacterium sp. Leaf117]KQP92060.1 peptide ABC transporter ATP-binding protein [Methylobacterium sp. Leaf117]
MAPFTSSLIPALFVLIWATGFVAARFVAPHAEAFTFVAIRVVGVALVLVGLALALRARWPRDRAGWFHAALAGILMQGIYVIGVFWSVQHGLPAGIAALVGSLQPLLTAMLAGRLLGEPVSGRRWLGIATGFSGALLVLAPKIGASDPAGIPVPALAACLSAMVAMTGGTLWQKRHGTGGDLLSNAALQFLGAATLAVPAALLFGTGGFDGSTPLWFGLAWSIVVNSVGGILLLLVLIRRGAVAGVASLLFLVPPVSAVMAYVLFGEALVPIQMGGMAIAALGVAIASRG